MYFSIDLVLYDFKAKGINSLSQPRRHFNCKALCLETACISLKTAHRNNFIHTVATLYLFQGIQPPTPLRPQYLFERSIHSELVCLLFGLAKDDGPATAAAVDLNDIPEDSCSLRGAALYSQVLFGAETQNGLLNRSHAKDRQN